MCDIQPQKMDLLILRLSDATEILDIEVSGPPFNSPRNIQLETPKNYFWYLFAVYVEYLQTILIVRLRILGHIACIQAIGDRLILFATSFINKKKYLAIELASCVIPFSFDAIQETLTFLQ